MPEQEPNEQQKKVINKTKGPCIVLAGAGTGKTSTIVEKIKNLVDNNLFKPEEILCLTFSIEATNSLKSKIRKSLKSFKIPSIRTFHGFCADILKEDGHLLGIDNEFQILEPDDSKILIHRELNVTPYWANRYTSTISTAKDFGIEKIQIEEYLQKLEEKLKEKVEPEELENKVKEIEFNLNTLHLEPNTKENRMLKKEYKEFLDLFKKYTSFKDFIEVWEKYDKIKKEKNMLNFSDLNHLVLHLFRKFGADKYTETFKYLIIDEFQDTNKIQFELIEHIAIEHKNITVVGDQNQSIYGFRGSYKESFNHFMKTYNATIKDEINLNNSYRSTNKILNIAHDLIQNNYDNPKDCIKTYNAKGIEGEKVKLIETKNMAEEARVIADIVEEKLKEGVEPKEICVLFRTHRQGDYLKEYLNSRNISIAQAGKSNLMSKREIKTTISYLSMLNNLQTRNVTADQSWWHIFHYKNLISMEDSLKIGKYLKKNKEKSIDEVLINSIKELNLNENSVKTINSILNKLNYLHGQSNLSIPDLILEIYELTGLNRAFSYQRTNKNIESLMNLKKFHTISENFAKVHGDDLSKFIDYLEILREIGVNIKASEIQNDNAIRIMTMHATKGLEYQCVIVSNLATGRFPLKRTQNEPLIPKELLPDLKLYLKELGELNEKETNTAIKEYEKKMLEIEERRLAYVAFTRAKKDLYLTFARSYDNEEDSAEESIFLNEIGYDNWHEQDKVEHENIEYIKDDKELNTSISPSSPKEKLLSKIKDDIIESLDSEDTNILLDKISEYKSIKEGKIINLNNQKEEYLKLLIQKSKDNFSGIKFDKSMLTFSPTGLLDYLECPKKFELARILQMPIRKDVTEEQDSANVGSFVHKILEVGVNEKFKSENDYLEYAKTLLNKDEYKDMPKDEVELMIKIFYARNKNKIRENSLTEIGLPLELEGYTFYGEADRIDELEDKTLEIIDYKSNKNKLEPKKRAFQMGYYAIAAKENIGKTPSVLTLEMLKLDKPDEFIVNGDDIYPKSGRGKGFNLKEVREELIQTANLIAKDFETEFSVAKNDNPCRYCGYKFYCPKWEE